MTKPLYPNAPSGDVPDAVQTEPPRDLPFKHCDRCQQRWEDVRFYGIPPSALCSGCPYRSKWTGKLFDGFE